MKNVLPYATGLTVDGVIYQYTAIKKQEDAMGVTIRNANAKESGYVFSTRDDWTGLKGTTITKVVPVDNIPGNLWGDGEMKVDGTGEVKDQAVFYKYRYDTCIINPLSSAACPGYNDALAKLPKEKIDENLSEYSQNKNTSLCLPTDTYCAENKTNKEDTEKNKKSKNDKKKENTNVMITNIEATIASQLEAMNAIPEAYKISLQGGTYKDIAGYPEKKLQDSRDARRLGLAQEALHKSMVDSQYDEK